MTDPTNPAHYRAHPSGVECIAITEHMGFCVGNAVKYLWRAGLKGDALEDLRKARWYVDREISRLEAAESRADGLASKNPPSRAEGLQTGKESQPEAKERA